MRRHYLRIDKMAGNFRVEFQEFWTRTVGKVRAYMFCACRNWADADDMTQDCYLRALRGWGQFNGSASREAWLFGIARRTSVDWFRRKKRQAATVAGANVKERSAIPPGEPGDKKIEKIWDAVGSLNADQSQVVYMRFAAGLSYAQIAQALGIPVGTVRSRLHRGLEGVRERIGRSDDET